MATKTGAETAADYGISEALLVAYPELRQVYELFKAENTSGALEALFKTNYYKNTSATVKAREKQKLEQPQVYSDNVVKYKLDARKRLVNAGIRIDTATFDKLAEDAYAKNLSDDQLDQAIITSGKITGFGGGILGSTNELKAFAASMGVGNLYNDAYWTQKGKDLFSGATTTTDIEQEIKNLAASAFPAYADGIAAGQSMQTQTSNIIQSLSNFLEIDPDTAQRHPLYRTLTSYIDPKTDKPSIMPQWLVERTIKSDKQWLYTKNGLETLDTLSMKPLQDWGLM